MSMIQIKYTERLFVYRTEGKFWGFPDMFVMCGVCREILGSLQATYIRVL